LKVNWEGQVNYVHLYYLALTAVCLYNVGKIWNNGHNGRSDSPGVKTVLPGLVQALGSAGLLAIAPEGLPLWLAPALLAASGVYIFTVALSRKRATVTLYYLRAFAYTVAGFLVLYGLYVVWQ
jgi:hypothetical protein